MSLRDITNSSSNKVNKKKRLSDGTVKTYSYTKTRKQFDISFADDMEKLVFENKLEMYKKKHGLKSVKDFFDHVLSTPETSANREEKSSSHYSNDSILGNAKCSTFLCENKKLFDLVNCLCNHHRNCDVELRLFSLSNCGHVVEIVWSCENGHTIKWESSSILAENYTINYRVMMSYLCSFMTQIGYERLSQFAEIGTLTEHFRNKASVTLSAVIDVITKESIQFALYDEIQQSKDNGENGISIMTDARHHCRKNSYHTDHVTLGQHTHKVINFQHINKNQEPSTQKHEKLGCEQMYNDFERQRVKVNIHSHDRNLSVNKFVKSKDDVRNCNERWHATKPVTQGLKKKSSGTRRNIGITWHPQLADKGARIRNHTYYAIDNCQNDPQKLRQIIDNCVPHFQNNHNDCALDSECKTPNYIPDYIIVDDASAVRLLTGFLHSLTLYKNAQDYALSKDTYYVESFNNTCLVYLDKRVHYKDKSYMIRINLAIFSWNEHVDMPFTSRWNPEEVQHNRRHLGKKKYKKKTYNFVNDIWVLLVEVLDGRQQLPDIDGNNYDSDHYQEDSDDE